MTEQRVEANGSACWRWLPGIKAIGALDHQKDCPIAMAGPSLQIEEHPVTHRHSLGGMKVQGDEVLVASERAPATLECSRYIRQKHGQGIPMAVERTGFPLVFVPVVRAATVLDASGKAVHSETDMDSDVSFRSAGLTRQREVVTEWMKVVERVRPPVLVPVRLPSHQTGIPMDTHASFLRSDQTNQKGVGK